MGTSFLFGGNIMIIQSNSNLFYNNGINNILNPYAPKVQEKIKDLYRRGAKVIGGIIVIDNHHLVLGRSFSEQERSDILRALNDINSDSQLAKPTYSTYVSKHSRNKEKKKTDKKKRKKARAAREKFEKTVAEEPERRPNLLAELKINSQSLIIVKDCLYNYNELSGSYEQLTEQKFSVLCDMGLSSDAKLRIKTSDYHEAYKLLFTDARLYTDEPFYKNGALVNCLNGVFDAENNILLKHSPDYRFNCCIQACYNPDASCEMFHAFVDNITQGNKKLKKLIQVMLGYIFSFYKDAKKAFVFLGDTDTGKTILCLIIELFFPDGLVKHNDFSNMSKPSYVVQLENAWLNIATDVSNTPLGDPGHFKNLVSSNDTVVASSRHSDPKTISGGVKMIFCTNHKLLLPSDLSQEDVNAIFSRLIYIPFLNASTPEKDKDPQLVDKLWNERDGIFTWAMDGLTEYISEGRKFPTCKVSSDANTKGKVLYCPEEVFFEQCLKSNEDCYESSKNVRAAFSSFCTMNEIEDKKKGDITKFLTLKGIERSRVRIDERGNKISKGNPKEAYKGIRISNKYRELLNI